jgi:hypothetical protein
LFVQAEDALGGLGQGGRRVESSWQLRELLILLRELLILLREWLVLLWELLVLLRERLLSRELLTAAG